MADYRLYGNGVIRESDGAIIPDSPGNPDWQEYLAWIDLGNTPDSRYSLSEAKILCTQKAISDYENGLERPITQGLDEMALNKYSRNKIVNAHASGKANSKVRKTDGRPINLTDLEIEDLIELINDRDDNDLDALDLVLDAIEDTETLEELEPYMP